MAGILAVYFAACLMWQGTQAIKDESHRLVRHAGTEEKAWMRSEKDRLVMSTDFKGRMSTKNSQENILGINMHRERVVLWGSDADQLPPSGIVPRLFNEKDSTTSPIGRVTWPGARAPKSMDQWVKKGDAWYNGKQTGDVWDLIWSEAFHDEPSSGGASLMEGTVEGEVVPWTTTIPQAGGQSSEAGDYHQTVKQTGWCVDGHGWSIPDEFKKAYEVHTENECWRDCAADKDVHGCSFNYDKEPKTCIQYLIAPAKGNGFDGYHCWVKDVDPNLKPPAHPCIQHCPKDGVPTCSSFYLMTLFGGCAYYCPKPVQQKLAAYLCGKKPACAQTCDEKALANCGFYNTSIQPNGCMYNCDEALKLEFQTELCGFQPLECSKGCTEHHVDCALYKRDVTDGGCAENCSDVEKEHYSHYFCPHKPMCAATCREDIVPTCPMYDDFVGPGKCAEDCSEVIKLEFKHEICGYMKPDCASSCPDNAVVSCSEYKVMTEPGGCAETCSDAVTEHFRAWTCGHVPLCAASCTNVTDAPMPTCDNWEYYVYQGESHQGCAASCTDKIKEEFKSWVCNTESTYEHASEAGDYHHNTTAGVWGSTHPYNGQKASTFEEAENEVKKVDEVIEGAEAMASLPDTTHTLAPMNEEDSEEEKKKKMAAAALLLVIVSCFWCICCCCFHRWALQPKTVIIKEAGEDQSAF